MMKKKKGSRTQTAIRLDDVVLARIDKLAEQMSEPGRQQQTRSDIHRMALFDGLSVLENAQLKKR